MKSFFTSLIIIFSTFTLFCQETIPFFSNSDKILISLNNSGSYKSMTVEVENKSSAEMKIIFPEGGVFINSSSSHQNLAILFYDECILSPGETKSMTIYTACMDPAKQGPSSTSDWTLNYDNKLGDLIRGYHKNRPMVEMMTGSENHDTFNERHNFLQMCVWVYFNADKQQILNFATKYVFDGNSQQAKEFVDVFYPMAVIFINLYKTF